MKKAIFQNSRLLVVLFGLVLLLSSCEYQKIVDANYPDQTVYIPIAKNGVLLIDQLNEPTLANPTPGNPYSFKLDQESNSFTVPLSVYRSGIDNSGEFTVDIEVNEDTINNLISAGDLSDVELLPSDKYSIESSVIIADGQTVGNFNLIVDLDFIEASSPGKKYAFGVSISSTQREVSAELNTAVVVIDSKMMSPVADFGYTVDPASWQEIIFTNNSLFGIDYFWDFGNGETSTEMSPSYVFPGEGAHNVTLTLKGVTGKESVLTKKVWVVNLENIVNVALNKPTTTNGNYNANYIGPKAVDGDFSNGSRWLSANNTEVHWIEIDLEQEYNIVSFKTWLGANGNFSYAMPTFSFQAMIDGEWVDLVNVTGNSEPVFEAYFPVTATSKVRYYVPSYGNNLVRLYEIEVYAVGID